MLSAGDAAFFLLLALSFWKVAEVILMLRAPKPVRMSRQGLEAAEVEAAEVAVRHFKSLDWCHTREGTRLHMRGCHALKETHEVFEKATSRRRGIEGKPHEVISRKMCSFCAVRLENSLRIELESTD